MFTSSDHPPSPMHPAISIGNIHARLINTAMPCSPWNCFGISSKGTCKLPLPWTPPGVLPCHGFDEGVIMNVARAFVSTGLKSAGYVRCGVPCQAPHRACPLMAALCGQCYTLQHHASHFGSLWPAVYDATSCPRYGVIWTVVCTATPCTLSQRFTARIYTTHLLLVRVCTCVCARKAPAIMM